MKPHLPTSIFYLLLLFSTTTFATDKTIGDFPSATTVSGTDVAPIFQGGVTKKAPFSVIKDYVSAVNADYAFTAAQTVTVTDSITNAVTTALTIDHETNGTPANGLGAGLLFRVEDSTTANVNAAGINAAWSDKTHATHASYLDFLASTGGAAPATIARLFGSGGLSVNSTSDPGAGIINANSGFRIANSAASGTIPIGDGANYVASTNTWPNAATTAGYKLRASSTTAYAPYPTGLVNSSASDNTSFASDTYIAGSSVTVAAGDFKALGQYRCVFDMTKTAAGTAAPTIDVRIGTAGTTGDTSRMTFTFSAGTAAADAGTFEVIITFRTVGSGTSAVISGICRAQHNLATTGLFSDAAAWTIVGTTSGGFDSSAATKIGLSFNGGSSFSGTNKLVQATLNQ